MHLVLKKTNRHDNISQTTAYLQRLNTLTLVRRALDRSKIFDTDDDSGEQDDDAPQDGGRLLGVASRPVLHLPKALDGLPATLLSHELLRGARTCQISVTMQLQPGSRIHVGRFRDADRHDDIQVNSPEPAERWFARVLRLLRLDTGGEVAVIRWFQTGAETDSAIHLTWYAEEPFNRRRPRSQQGHDVIEVGSIMGRVMVMTDYRSTRTEAFILNKLVLHAPVQAR